METFIWPLPSIITSGEIDMEEKLETMSKFQLRDMIDECVFYYQLYAHIIYLCLQNTNMYYIPTIQAHLHDWFLLYMFFTYR